MTFNFQENKLPEEVPPPPDADELEGRRLHSWVLVLCGKRDISADQGHFFIEPSTGVCTPVRSANYHGIESLWNHKNYWVNMQPQTTSVQKLSYDLTNTDNWEYVFIDSMTARRKKREAMNADDGMMGGGGDEFSSMLGSGMGEEERDEEKGDEAVEEDEDLEEDGVDVLDIPPSWVLKLKLDRDSYAQRFFASGQQITLFNKAKRERFAEHFHPQGLVERVTEYQDFERTIPLQILERFVNRHDKVQHSYITLHDPTCRPNITHEIQSTHASIFPYVSPCTSLIFSCACAHGNQKKACVTNSFCLDG